MPCPRARRRHRPAKRIRLDVAVREKAPRCPARDQVARDILRRITVDEKQPPLPKAQDGVPIGHGTPDSGLRSSCLLCVRLISLERLPLRLRSRVLLVFRSAPPKRRAARAGL